MLKSTFSGLQYCSTVYGNTGLLYTMFIRWVYQIGLPLTSSLLLEYSSEYLSEYSSTR